MLMCPPASAAVIVPFTPSIDLGSHSPPEDDFSLPAVEIFAASAPIRTGLGLFPLCHLNQSLPFPYQSGSHSRYHHNHVCCSKFLDFVKYLLFK